MKKQTNLKTKPIMKGGFIEYMKTKNVEILDMNDVVIVSFKDKTATNILKEVKALQDRASDLVVQLATACGTCSMSFGCAECYDLDDEDFTDVPEAVFNTFLDTNICLRKLYDLINSDEIIENLE